MPSTVREYAGAIRSTVKSFWHGMSIMAQGGHLPPFWASWTANILGLGAGGILIARAAS